MPSIEWNRQLWGVDYDWPEGGEEWSRVWGGSDAQWRGAILPRIGGLLPTGLTVEIGCGFGRYSHWLREWTQRLLLFDLVDRCVEACLERFSQDPDVQVLRNDGLSLPGVEARSVDFVFSFDSLVHAEIDVLAAYLRELSRVLAPDGAAFLHHSNFKAVLDERQESKNWHFRGETASAAGVRQIASVCDLLVIRQEVVDWGLGSERVEGCDCFTTIVRPEGVWCAEGIFLRNPFFMEEARSIAVRRRLYGP